MFYLALNVVSITIAVVTTLILSNRGKVLGYIEVDEKTEQVRVHINELDITDLKTKRVVLEVIHNADISRE